MPRKGSNEEQATVTNETSTEAPVEVPTGEVPGTPESAPDISAFISVAEASLSTEDYASVTTAYNELDRKGKGLATRHVNAEIKKALHDKQLERAMGLSQLTTALTPVKATKEKKVREPKAAVDNTQSITDRLASLYIGMKVAQAQLPADKADEIKAAVQTLATETQADVDALVAWRVSTDEAKGDAPEVPEVVSRAVKLAFTGTAGKRAAGGSSTSTYEGPRRSIGQHIAEAFADHPSGTFLTVSEIRNFESSVYGTDHPSAGAISSALKAAEKKGKNVADGISGASGGEKGNYGATKA